MINENFKYINEAQKCADYMLEHLYEMTLWWMDTAGNAGLSDDELNELHSEFMSTVMTMMLQD